MIATEPLSDAFWADARLETRPTFADFRHMIIYGQRTADGRFAFGGRGTPYHFGSRVRPQFDLDPRVFDALHATLRSLFPALGDAAITHRWGGAVGVPATGTRRSASTLQPVSRGRVGMSATA